MILHVFNTELERIGILDNYLSVAWEEDYHGRGNFLLVCVDSPQNIALLQQGWYIYRTEKETAMIIRYVKYESAVNQITIRGYTTNDLLKQRIVYPTKNIYNVENGMYSIVSDNRRGLPSHVNAPATGIAGTFEKQFTGDEVTEALSVLGKESQIGYYTKFDHRNKQHVFTVYQGKDRTIGKPDSFGFFSTEYGNLANTIIVDDMSIFKNVAYVGGAGEGAARKWVIIGDATGLDRFEMHVDARDIQPDEESGETVESPAYIQRLTARGIQKINEQIRVKTFIAEVDPAGFGKDFYLGDIVSCKSIKYGVQINTRILHYAEVREGGKTKLSLTLGEPEITTLQEVKTWLN